MKNTLNLLKHIRRYLLGYHSRPVNLAIIHFGRVGSTVLQDSLNQHPDIHMVGEPWEAFRRSGHNLPVLLRTPRRLIWYYLCQTRQPVFGLQIKLYPEEHLRRSLLNMSIEEGFKWLLGKGISHFIFIKRDNHLERIISDTRGVASGRWHLRSDESNEISKVKLDPEAVHFGETYLPILESFRRLDKYEEEILNLMRPLPHLVLNFEKDIEEDPIVAVGKVLDFLKISAFAPSVHLRRTNAEPWHKKITNPDEIRRVLKGSEYSWMME
jgi:hypothetical protein